MSAFFWTSLPLVFDSFPYGEVVLVEPYSITDVLLVSSGSIDSFPYGLFKRYFLSSHFRLYAFNSLLVGRSFSVPLLGGDSRSGVQGGQNPVGGGRFL